MEEIVESARRWWRWFDIGDSAVTLADHLQEWILSGMFDHVSGHIRFLISMTELSFWAAREILWIIR